MRIAVVALEETGLPPGEFLVEGLFPHWRAAGHEVLVAAGPGDLPEADVALLHVDLTVIPDEYQAVLRKYPVVINGATGDIGKRAFSRNLLRPGDRWDGPVIVKTNLNCAGLPEAWRRKLRQQQGKPAGPPVRFLRGRYPVLPSAEQVPPGAWHDPDLVVEKFLPERDPSGAFALRIWIFLGDRERCTRWLGDQPVVKGSDVRDRAVCPVPPELREERRRLGFDFGKFDFVIHDGRPVLLDVNRTPTAPARLSPAIVAGNQELAKGIDGFLQRARSASVGKQPASS